MAPRTGGISVTKLRLASARRRVRAFLDQIADLEASDFPHDGARQALAYIKQNFTVRENSLATLPDGVDENVVDQMCLATGVAVQQYTQILGFILRSTNVRNAFETHYPLQRLIEQVISPQAQLILSSEWDFTPFTYPMNLDLLPNFVLIGGPAIESGNVFTLPLAGHEVGHSAWRAHGVRKRIEGDLVVALAKAMHDNPPLVARITSAGVGLPLIQNNCLAVGLKQLEEIFCDQFGTYLFGQSYIYAYEYFLAPGRKERSAYYPSGTDRIAAMMAAAAALGIAVESDLFRNWTPSDAKPGPEGAALALADTAVAALVPTIQGIAFSIFAKANIAPNDEAAVARVEEAFNCQVPDSAGATLFETVTAGWRYLRKRGGLADDAQRTEYAMLNELMLKSIEVSEFQRRLAGNA